MKKTYWKYVLSSIKKDFTRLLAIFLIVTLGVGFLVGLMSVTPDLQETANNYYLENNLTDVYISSTIGFSKDDDLKIKGLVSGIRKIDNYDQMDQNVYLNNDKKIQGRVIYRTFDEHDIDKLTLVEGRFPTEPDECVMLDPISSMTKYKINDTVRVDESIYTIVGKVSDPYYMSDAPEQTIIGNGILDSIIYINEEYNLTPTYTTIKITFDEARKYSTFSNEYTDFIHKKQAEIDLISQSIIEDRVKEVKSQLTEGVKLYLLEELKKEFPNISASEQIMNDILDAIAQTESFQKMVDDEFNERFGTPKWYILSRSEIPSAYMFKLDSNKIDSIAKIFPVFFYLITLLVCIASITRIVNNDRQYMGTLKSLGYKKITIYKKYLFYGILTSVLGSIIGSIFGIFVLPFIVHGVYCSLYNLPKIIFTFPTAVVFGYSSIMIALILLTIILITHGCLKEHVSSLLTGKAPVAGKKILLEKIPWLWSRLKFRSKSMLRNVFRFKKNLIMMLIGVGGCTGILLTSFGIKDSLNVLNTDQYTTILKYDLVVNVNNIEENPIKDYVNSPIYYYNSKVLDNKDNLDVTLLSSNDMPSYVGFDEGINFNDSSVIVTKQIADDLNLEIGNKITLDIRNGQFMQLQITGITTNYIENYVYVGEKQFKKSFPTLEKNAYIVKTGLQGDELDTYIRSLVNLENVKGVKSVTQSKETYESILNNLNAIVLILVLVSGTLIAVVIYNLTDIMITERFKEIATLRVLGYQRREALFYIFKEIVFMSIFGILFGLGFGVFLHHFVILRIVSAGLTFGMTIHWTSYIYTTLLTILFITLTSFVFYPRIVKIKMAEALKSVE